MPETRADQHIQSTTQIRKRIVVSIAVASLVLLTCLTGRANGGDAKAKTSHLSATQFKATEHALHFETWTEPTEQSYTLSIPKGWKVKSSMHRQGGSVPTIYYEVQSPGADIVILYNLPDGVNFTAPNRMSMQMGMREGQNGLLHYMSATEFNKLFLRQFLGKGIIHLKIESAQDDPKSAQQMLVSLQGDHAVHQVSVGLTVFSGTDAKSGRPIAGALQSLTMSTGMPSSDLVTWNALPMMVTAEGGDAQMAARQRNAVVSFLHVTNSYQEMPEWLARQDEVVRKANGISFQSMIAASKSNSAAIAVKADRMSRAMAGFKSYIAPTD